jgi:predicted Rossmann fold nucleotide-binding protein DprA/Smf involved in DNA uptake
VQNARDVLAELHGPSSVLDDPMRPPGRLAVESSLPAKGLLRHLADGVATDPGRLAARLGLPVGDVLGRLSALEIEGSVRREGGGYVKVHGRETTRREEE